MEEASRKMSLKFLDEIFEGGKKWILKEENLHKVQASLATLPEPSTLSLEVHEKICLGLASCLEFQPNLWRFAGHYLLQEHPPFKRLIKQSEESSGPPPKKKNKSEIKSKQFV